MRPDKLTEAISRLTEAEIQLEHAITGSSGNHRLHLEAIKTEARRARMRIEEHKEECHGGPR